MTSRIPRLITVFLRLAFAFALTLTLSLPALARDDDKDKDKAKDKPATGDLKAMQGTWTSKDDSGESTWEFKGDKLSIKTPTRAYEKTCGPPFVLDTGSIPSKPSRWRGMDTPSSSCEPSGASSRMASYSGFGALSVTLQN